ncbi:stearoyl-CoA desaturase (delta-9 desaturase) [Allocatelliglobosispora scoriae]|uniref:Stearoyl-CoA desaturase (Delta-9 desaturase) n=1 Tax=Allocatelliglobosispora scoriae TaxID=643052 RepID=A0A841BTG4_9ACTN|nr:acyl-CoA desaturase [Allocatelliglobosispora scoriae]MBB5870449.1 stearoyl-CoA desaturase (delta-9 desaturase) [Allocatelliglobosispora scoriae]
MTTTLETNATGAPAIEQEIRGPKPLTEGPQSKGILIGLWIFVVIPFAALIAAIPIAWGGWLSVTDALIALVWYPVAGLGITVGFHRYLTHGSFKAKRWLRVALAVAGSFAVQGSPTQWVADHRRHHAFSDNEGDPHSPWRFGSTFRGLTKGLWHAHMGWLFAREMTNRARFAPDLMADKDIRRVDKLFPALVALSLVAPAAIGGLVTWSWQGALTALFWAGLVRVGLLHHVTWSINSICHVYGERPFETRDGDKASNFWPLAILSFGESWHNLHHSDPTCARHGVLRGQIDSSARLIWLFEKFGWASNVRWPKLERIQQKMIDGGEHARLAR